MPDYLIENSLGLLRRLRAMAEVAQEKPMLADVPWRGQVYTTPALQALAHAGYYSAEARKSWLSAIDSAIKSVEASNV